MFFSVNVSVLFSNVSCFLPILLLKLSHFLQVDFFSWLDIIKVSFTLSTTSQYSSTTKAKLDFTSSIWGDDHILRIDEKNWKCLWCNTIFQGINATKALAHVLRKKGMDIKSCYVPKDTAHMTRYQELHHYKQTRKGVLLGYS